MLRSSSARLLLCGLALPACADKGGLAAAGEAYTLQAIFVCDPLEEGDLLYLAADVRPDPSPDQVWARIGEDVVPLAYDDVDEAWFTEREAALLGLSCADIGETRATFEAVVDGEVVVDREVTLEEAGLPGARQPTRP